MKFEVEGTERVGTSGKSCGLEILLAQSLVDCKRLVLSKRRDYKLVCGRQDDNVAPLCCDGTIYE